MPSRPHPLDPKEIAASWERYAAFLRTERAGLEQPADPRAANRDAQWDHDNTDDWTRRR